MSMYSKTPRQRGMDAREKGEPIDNAADLPMFEQDEWRSGWNARDRMMKMQKNIEDGLNNRPKAPVSKSIYSE